MSKWLSAAVIGLVAATHGLLGQEGGRVSGWTLTPDGRPLGGVDVALPCPPAPVQRTVSDESGRFDLTNLAPGNCRLIARKRGYVDASDNGEPGAPGGYGLAVTAGAWRDGFELRLAKGAVLTGRVKDKSGPTVRAIRVQPIRREKHNGAASNVPLAYQLATASGEFEFTALPPGEYYVAASAAPEETENSGWSTFRHTYFPGTAFLSRAQLVVLNAGDSKRVEFALVAARTFRVSGVVHDMAGRPLANAQVTLEADTPPRWLAGSGRTSADGTFAFGGLQPGAYRVRAGRNLEEHGEVLFDVTYGDVSDLVVRVGPRR